MKKRIIAIALLFSVLFSACSTRSEKSDSYHEKDEEPTTEEAETTTVTTTTEQTTVKETSEQTTTSSESVSTSKTPKFLPEMLDYSSKYIGRKYLDVEQTFYDDFRLNRSDYYFDIESDYKHFRTKEQTLVFEGKRLYLGWDNILVDNKEELVRYVTGFTFYSEITADDSINKEFEDFYELLTSTYGEPEVISHWLNDAPTYIWDTGLKSIDDEEIYVLLYMYSYNDWDLVNDCEIVVSGYELKITKKCWE